MEEAHFFFTAGIPVIPKASIKLVQGLTPASSQLSGSVNPLALWGKSAG